jgi:hypothetical protein
MIDESQQSTVEGLKIKAIIDRRFLFGAAYRRHDLFRLVLRKLQHTDAEWQQLPRFSLFTSHLRRLRRQKWLLFLSTFRLP